MPRRPLSARSTSNAQTPAPTADRPSPPPEPSTASGSASPEAPSRSVAVATSSTPRPLSIGAGLPGPGRLVTITKEPERVQIILDALGRGHYLQHAADLAGLTRTAVARWMTIGETDAEEGHDSPYARFFIAAQQKLAGWTDQRVQAIQRAEDKDWKAGAALLGRRHRGLWSEQTTAGGESGHGSVQIHIGIALPGTGQSTQVIEGTVVDVPQLDD